MANLNQIDRLLDRLHEPSMVLLYSKPQIFPVTTELVTTQAVDFRGVDMTFIRSILGSYEQSRNSSQNTQTAADRVTMFMAPGDARSWQNVATSHGEELPFVFWAMMMGLLDPSHVLQSLAIESPVPTDVILQFASAVLGIGSAQNPPQHESSDAEQAGWKGER